MQDKLELIISSIIESGRLDNYSNLDKLFPDWNSYDDFLENIHTEIVKENTLQNLHPFDIYNELANKYDFESLYYLIKGLTIIENNTNHGGSVSPIIFLYKNLVKKAGLSYLTTGDRQGVYILTKSLEKNPNDKIEKLTHWILNTTKNIYVPFGISTLSAKTIADIKIEIENWVEQQNQFAINEKNAKILKAEREAIRKLEVSKKIEIHNAKTNQEREYRQTLADLNSRDLLKIILDDDKRPIYYYSRELNKIENLDSDSKRLLKQIILKFKDIETGQFKRLKIKLSTMIS